MTTVMLTHSGSCSKWEELIVVIERILGTFLIHRARFPNFVIGFDLVGQETVFDPNSLFADQINSLAGDTRFFFHAGETSELKERW